MNEFLEEKVCEETLTGDKLFCGLSELQSLQVVDFWKWSASNLLDNTTRGIVAEFLVAAALGLHRNPRIEWEPYDLKMRELEVTIEVKSSASYQAWKQERSSPIEFTIARRKRWDPEKRQWSEKAGRWAQPYVFCVLDGCDPLNLDAWNFLVLRTSVLEKMRCKGTKIRLGPLKELGAECCKYAHLNEAVERAAKTTED